MHIQSPGIVRTVYSSIFKDIQAYSEILMHILPHPQARNQRGEGGLPVLYENRKKGPDFGNKCPDFVHHWVKFFHHFSQDVVSKVSRKKTTKSFRTGPLFLVFDEMFIEVPQFHNSPCPEIFLVAHLHSGVILFAKRFISNVLQCSRYVCLGNCSANCTVTSCYVLYQTYSE